MLKELTKIRELLTPKPTSPPPPPKGLWNEFLDFLSKYKVMGLAVAFIMAIYLGGLVQSLVKDLIIPVIGLAIPGLADLASLEYGVREQVFGIGNFGGSNNIRHCSLCYLHTGESHKTMGNRLKLSSPPFFQQLT